MTDDDDEAVTVRAQARAAVQRARDDTPPEQPLPRAQRYHAQLARLVDGE